MQTKNQRVNRLMYLAAGIVATIIMTLGLFTQAKASTPIIAGCSSAYRKNANQATAWVYSNTAGKIYYVVDEQESTTLTGEEIVAQGTQSGSVALNGICGASLNIGMYAGTKYAHLVVVDDADATNISDVMTIKMAEDYMFSETFEAYPDNYGASVSGFEFGADNKVVTDGGQKVYQVYGNGGENTKNASIDSTQSGDVPDTRILEGKIKSGADSPVAEIGMYCWDGSWSTWDPAASVRIDHGTWKFRGYNYETNQNIYEALDLMAGESAVKDTWYTVRIVYDSGPRIYDVYINGKKANSKPLPAHKRTVNHISLSGGAGQYTCFDDVKYESYPSQTVADPRVQFSHSSGNYVAAQNIKLFTAIGGKNIYYTMDGTYPNPGAGGSSTILYDPDAGIDIDQDTNADGNDDHITTIRAIAGRGTGTGFIADSVPYEETYTFVPKPILTDGGIFRGNDTTADVYVKSNTAGDVYYLPSQFEQTVTADGIFAEGTKYPTKLEQDTTTRLHLDQGISRGPNYIYMVVADKDDQLSDVVCVKIPDYRYFEDTFEEFSEGATEGPAAFGFDNGLKVKTLDGDKALMIANGAGKDFTFEHSGRLRVFDVDYCSVSDEPSIRFGFANYNSYSGNWYWRSGIRIVSGEWNYYKDGTDDYYDLDRISGKIVPNRWYNVRIIYDSVLKCFDIYIDGVKANSEPLPCENDTNRIGFWGTAGQTMYFDNLKVYSPTIDADTVVRYDPTGRSFVTDQKVKLDTLAARKSIVYTTDGSEPSTTIGGSTKLYDYDNNAADAGIDIKDATMKIRTMIGTTMGSKFVPDSVIYDETYTYLSNGPAITGKSVSRMSATQAYVWFYSDASGKAYYYVNTDASPVGTEAIEAYVNEHGYSTFTVEEEKVTSINVSANLSSGAKFVHVFVKDAEGNPSNELVFEMPEDVYKYEDFEEFPNLTDGYSAYNNQSGTDLIFAYNENCKNVSDPTDSTHQNNVYAVSGYRTTVYFAKKGLGIYDNGTVIYEGKVMSQEDLSDVCFGMGENWNVGIALEDGEWRSVVGKNSDLNNAIKEAFANASKLPVYEKNKWYSLRIVYDKNQKVFDAYIDGIKANDAPIAALSDVSWSHHFSMGAEGTTTAYFDDITYYCFDARETAANSVVRFSPKEATYTTPKNITLSTKTAGRTIYYSLGDQYPDPGNEEMKYSEPFEISESTKIRAIAGQVKNGVFLAESVPSLIEYTIAPGAKLSGGSVERKSATKAKIHFRSDMDGDAYYLVSSDAQVPTAAYLVEHGIKVASIKANESKAIEVTKDMSARAKYIYAVLQDEEGICSNVLTYEMPYDYYFFANMESATEDGSDVWGSWDRYNWNHQEEDSDNMVYGYNYNSYQSMYDAPGLPNGEGKIVFETRIKSSSDNPTFSIGCGNDNQALLSVSSGTWKVIAGSGNTVILDNLTEYGFVRDRWYKIRIEYNVYSRMDRTVNVWVDGQLANSTPITAISQNTSNTIWMLSAQLVYFDDIKWYIDQSDVPAAKTPRVKKNLTYNGSEQTGIEQMDTTGSLYEITGTTQATLAGTYEATFTLPNGYKWPDGSSEPKTLSWSIAKKPLSATYTASKTYDGT